MTIQESNKATTVIDGFIINMETGEIVGMEKPEFRVTDEASADWVLEKMMDAQTQIARIGIKRTALLENLESQEKVYLRKLDWLMARFSPELEEFAKGQLIDAKTKTLKLTFGKLSIRSVKGGLRVSDQASALETAQSLGWTNAIKYSEAFQISGLTDAQRAVAENKPGFEVKPDTETFKIETGVK